MTCFRFRRVAKFRLCCLVCGYPCHGDGVHRSCRNACDVGKIAALSRSETARHERLKPMGRRKRAVFGCEIYEIPQKARQKCGNGGSLSKITVVRQNCRGIVHTADDDRRASDDKCRDDGRDESQGGQQNVQNQFHFYFLSAFNSPIVDRNCFFVNRNLMRSHLARPFRSKIASNPLPMRKLAMVLRPNICYNMRHFQPLIRFINATQKCAGFVGAAPR